ncbi:MAG: SigB/SigF/SigG family RNA polymerase sigma factor [Peptostreptococcaceae bacterium]|nr:SigB/SigF/SigG family RNA polymerase sigma factor [Peptostreptococcaceae bacterium]
MSNSSSKKKELFVNQKFKEYETKELFILFANERSREVRNEIVNRHMYIAELLSKRYIGKGIEYEDIFQIASLALIYAVERFDISKGYEFSSFATPTVVGEIKRYFRDKGWAIKVPRKTQELALKINDAKEKLQSDMGNVPKVKDIAKYLEATEEEVMEAMEASQLFSIRSLDLMKENNDNDSSISFVDVLGKEDQNFVDIENIDFIKRFVEKLENVEKQIVIGRFFENKTQVVIARELELSQMTISRIEKKVLMKLKEEYIKAMN